MASVFDVAVYILDKVSSCTHMKLQKLVYYSQAWSLVWDEQPLFDEPVEAWANGPVVPPLYQALKGSFKVTREDLGDKGNAEALNETARETVDAVVDYYARHDSWYLSELTHMESPWKDARRGLSPGERGSTVITQSAMAEYYGSLTPDNA